MRAFLNTQASAREEEEEGNGKTSRTRERSSLCCSRFSVGGSGGRATWGGELGVGEVMDMKAPLPGSVPVRAPREVLLVTVGNVQQSGRGENMELLGDRLVYTPVQ